VIASVAGHEGSDPWDGGSELGGFRPIDEGHGVRPRLASGREVLGAGPVEELPELLDLFLFVALDAG
jgi:hypothetical protein